MKSRLQIYGRGDYSHKHGDFATEVNTIGTRRMLVGTHRGGGLPARPVRWILGKSGDAPTQEFEVLFKGQDSAETGSEVGGYSLEFCAVSSVSILWRDGDDHVRDELEAAFDAAVVVGMQFAIEQIFGSYIDGEFVPVSDVHAINYYHSMKSREAEPALHQHILINNYGHLPNGDVAGIDAENFKTKLEALGNVVGNEFHNQLSQRLSVKWIDRSMAHSEIEGIDVPADYSRFA
jgi:TrwC relaxase